MPLIANGIKANNLMIKYTIADHVQMTTPLFRSPVGRGGTALVYRKP